MKTSNDLRCVAEPIHWPLFVNEKRPMYWSSVAPIEAKLMKKFTQVWLTKLGYSESIQLGGGLCRLRTSTLTTPVSRVSCHVAWATFVVRVHAVKHWVWQGLWCADPFFCQSMLVFMSSLRIRKILVTTSHSRWSSTVGCYPCKFHSCLAK